MNGRLWKQLSRIAGTDTRGTFSERNGMISNFRYLVLAVAAIPFIYYLIALFSSWQFFRRTSRQSVPDSSFTPPISNLKPIRGIDPDAYENFASFCRQDYPDYEVLFCVGEEHDPVVPILQPLMRDFPEDVFACCSALAQRDRTTKWSSWPDLSARPRMKF